jgi:FecR protein
MKRFSILSIAAILAAIGLFASNLHANQTAGWAVVVANNAFVARGAAAAAPVAIGTGIGQGDRLTTRAGGALVLSRGEDLVTMAENSEIVITDPQPLNATLIQQPAGKVQYHVTKGPTPHFEVDSPLLATVVKGTTFSVVADKGRDAVTVTEGRVVARDRRSGNSSSVGAGQTGAVAVGRNDVSVGAASSSDSGASGDSSSGGSDSSSGNGNSGNGNSGSGDSGSGDSGSGNSGSGNSGGNGKGNANGHHDGKGKNG